MDHLSYSEARPPVPFSSGVKLVVHETLDSTLCTHAHSLHLCLTLCDPVDPVHQAPPSMGFPKQEMLAWVAIPFSRGSSRPRDQTSTFYVSCIGRRVLYH